MGLALRVAEAVAVGLAVRLGVGVALGVRVGVTVLVGVGVGVGESELKEPHFKKTAESQRLSWMSQMASLIWYCCPASTLALAVSTTVSPSKGKALAWGVTVLLM